MNFKFHESSQGKIAELPRGEMSIAGLDDAGGRSLRDFIRESNRTGHIIFTDNLDIALTKLGYAK